MSKPKGPLEFLVDDDNGTQEPLVLEKVMRTIPKRRICGRARWRDQDVFAKIFLAVDRVEKHLAREKEGSAALESRGIKTAAIVHCGSITGPDLPDGARVLLFRWVAGAINLDKLVHSSLSVTKSLSLLKNLVRTIAEHHESGVLQKDLHFGNFAVCDQEIFTFDAGSIEVKRNAVNKSDAQDNLTLLFAQIDPAYNSSIPMLVDVYIAERGHEDLRPDIPKLWRKTLKERHRRMDRFMDKTLRSCRLTQEFELASGRKVLLDKKHAEELESVVDGIEANEDLKDGREVPLFGKRLRLRVYDTEGSTVFGFGDKGPASRAWQNAHRLQLEGVPTAQPLALLQASGKGSAWFLSEHPIASSLETVLKTQSKLTDEFAEQVAHLLQRLEQLNLSHGKLLRRSFIYDDKTVRLVNLETLSELKDRDVNTRAVTTQDMQDALECWRDHAFYEVLRNALQRRGFALDYQ